MTGPGTDPALPRSVDEVPAAVALPADPVCLFLSGSLVTGWSHANSDIDLYVVTDAPVPVRAPTALRSLGLYPEPVPVAACHDDAGRRWDVEYWPVPMVDRLLEAVARRDDGWLRIGDRMTRTDVDCYYRLSVGVALTGGPWLAAVQRRIADSALPTVLASREFALADGSIEDAAGLLASGDPHSAALAARLALGHAVDGFLAGRGSYAPSTKWRYRKLQALADPVLGAADYWSLEAMRGADPDQPGLWVELVLETCQKLIMEVDFS
jgi:hypothetical protein